MVAKISRIAPPLAFALAAVLSAPAAFADDTWDGMWVSGIAKIWAPARVYFSGNQLLAFFWNGDYVPDIHGSLSLSDGVMTITWTRGQAVLTRSGPDAAHLLVEQKGKADANLSLVAERE
jgi:hypothetical protein